MAKEREAGESEAEAAADVGIPDETDEAAGDEGEGEAGEEWQSVLGRLERLEAFREWAENVFQSLKGYLPKRLPKPPK